MENVDTICEYTIIQGFRSNSNLLYIQSESQIYKYKYTNNNIKYYYCYNVKCKVGVAIDNNNAILCRKLKTSSQVHEHGPQNELYEKFKLINSIKSEVKNAPLKEIKKRQT